jgi:hypothetical protein
MGIIDEVEAKLIYLQIEKQKRAQKLKVVSKDDLEQLQTAEVKIWKVIGSTDFKMPDVHYYWGM